MLGTVTYQNKGGGGGGLLSNAVADGKHASWQLPRPAPVRYDFSSDSILRLA